MLRAAGSKAAVADGKAQILFSIKISHNGREVSTHCKHSGTLSLGSDGAAEHAGDGTQATLVMRLT